MYKANKPKESSDGSTGLLKTVIIEEDFQQASREEGAKHLLYSLGITGASSGAH